MRILITGGTGCVGRHLIDELLRASADHHLVLPLRNPSRLPELLRDHPRITVYPCDLRDLAVHPEALTEIDVAVLVATSWGPNADAVIRAANLAVAARLIAGDCGHMLYFATASVLGADGSALPEAVSVGTPYIRGKADLLAGMDDLRTRAGRTRITGLFPTLVIGGQPGRQHPPMSHLARLLRQIMPRFGLLRLLSVAARCHIVHAADIARVTCHLIEHPDAASDRLVLGNPATSFDDLIRQAARHQGRRARRIVVLRPWMAKALIAVFRIRLSPWDEWCLHHPDQTFQRVVNPADFGLPVTMPDLAAGLALIGIPPVSR